MSRRPLYFAPIVALALSSLLSGAVSAQADNESNNDDSGGGRAVFVQSNDLAANQVLAYRREGNGTLTPTASYNTGGKGGRLNGAMSDPLGSQGALKFDAAQHLLIGVNAGSNTIYAFRVQDGRLSERQVLSSEGVFPASVAIHEDLVYVLNARGTGTVHGFRVSEHGRLESIPDSTRSLNLVPNPGPTEFVTTPGQVGFSPDGRHLIVTTKANANGNHIDVFAVDEDGQLSTEPVVNPSQTPVPFAFTFDPQRRLVVGEAATSDVSTYVVHDDGTLTPVATATDGQGALCWIARDGRIYFVSNTASGTVSSFEVAADGHPKLLVNNPVGPGPIDIGVPSGGRFLYVELGGNGTIAELRVNRDGTLLVIGTVAGHVGEEGIVAL